MTQEHFTRRVMAYLRDGYGVEDIAIMLGCNVAHVRAEVEILRDEGNLARLSGSTRWGPTALRLMERSAGATQSPLTDAGKHA